MTTTEWQQGYNADSVAEDIPPMPELVPLDADEAESEPSAVEGADQGKPSDKDPACFSPKDPVPQQGADTPGQQQGPGMAPVSQFPLSPQGPSSPLDHSPLPQFSPSSVGAVPSPQVARNRKQPATYEEKLRMDREAMDQIQWAATKEDLHESNMRREREERELQQVTESMRAASIQSGRASTGPRQNEGATDVLEVYGIAGSEVRTEHILEELGLMMEGAPKPKLRWKWLDDHTLYIFCDSAASVDAILQSKSPKDFKIKMWEPDTSVASSPASTTSTPTRSKRPAVNVKGFNRMLQQTMASNNVCARNERERSLRLSTRLSKSGNSPTTPSPASST